MAVASVSNCFPAFLRDGFDESRFVVEEVGQDTVWRSEILRGVADVELVRVSRKSAQFPVAGVLNAPVASDGVLD